MDISLTRPKICHGMNKKNRKASFGGVGPSGGAKVPSKARDTFRITTNLKASQASIVPPPERPRARALRRPSRDRSERSFSEVRNVISTCSWYYLRIRCTPPLTHSLFLLLLSVRITRKRRCGAWKDGGSTGSRASSFRGNESASACASCGSAAQALRSVNLNEVRSMRGCRRAVLSGMILSVR